MNINSDVMNGLKKPVYVTNILRNYEWPNEFMKILLPAISTDDFYHNTSGFITNLSLEKNSTT